MKPKNGLLKSRFFIAGVVLCIFALAPASFAKIAIQPDFEGTLIITLPNGEIILVEPGQPLPDIPSDSIVEVYSGKFTVNTEDKDSVQVGCLGNQGNVSGGASAALSCGENEGTLKALKGSVPLTDSSGNAKEVPEGEEVPIYAKEGPKAAPTGAGGPEGGEPLGGNIGDEPPVDTRSLESSPST